MKNNISRFTSLVLAVLMSFGILCVRASDETQYNPYFALDAAKLVTGASNDTLSVEDDVGMGYVTFHTSAVSTDYANVTVAGSGAFDVYPNTVLKMKYTYIKAPDSTTGSLTQKPNFRLKDPSNPGDKYPTVSAESVLKEGEDLYLTFKLGGHSGLYNAVEREGNVIENVELNSIRPFGMASGADKASIGWYDHVDPMDILIVKSVEIYKTDYSITFDVNGGNGKNTTVISDGGRKIEFPNEVPSLEGKFFLGWGESKDATEPLDEVSFVPTSDKTLYAIYSDSSAPAKPVSKEERYASWTAAKLITGGSNDTMTVEEDSGSGFAELHSSVASTDYANTAVGSGAFIVYPNTVLKMKYTYIKAPDSTTGALVQKPNFRLKDPTNPGDKYPTVSAESVLKEGEELYLTFKLGDNVGLYSPIERAGKAIEGVELNSIRPFGMASGADKASIGWYDHVDPRDILIVKSVEIYKTDYTVTFDVNGGKGAGSETVSVGGGKITFPTETPTMEGKPFIGWGTSPDSAKTVNEALFMPTSDMTLYAIYDDPDRVELTEEEDENAPVVYDFRYQNEDGSIPQKTGENYIGYFPDAKNLGYNTPEMQTWYPGMELSITDDERKLLRMDNVRDGVFGWNYDACPKHLYINDFKHRYFLIVVKSDSAFEGKIRLKSLGNKTEKYLNVPFTGEWQRVIVDLGDPTGFYGRDGDGNFTLHVSETPYSVNGNDYYGGFRIEFSGMEHTSGYTFDAFAFFTDKTAAENYSINVPKDEIKSTAVAKPVIKRELRPKAEPNENYFISGYTDGTVRPNKPMTRAEAVTVLARLITSEEDIAEARTTSFTDIKASDWYYNYVALVESEGALGLFGNEFKPNQNITRGEFVDIAFNLSGFTAKSDNDVDFNDIESSPYKPAILAAVSSGAVNGYSDGTFRPQKAITRAEIVTILCRLLNIEERNDMIQSFTDLDKSHWAYGNIMAAAIPKQIVKDFAVTSEKIKEVDALSDKRKNSILTSATDVDYSGNAYYVSASGNDDNDGLTPEKPWKTISKVSSAPLENGDAVFFKRGDIFRLDGGELILKNGVTYSAYGEGDKPRIYGSEDASEKTMWTLVDGTKNIWCYSKSIIDIGTVVFDGGKAYGIKKTPYFRNGRYENADGSAFNVVAALNEDEDLSFFSYATNGNNTPVPNASMGKLYLRCDAGNPAEVYSSIELPLSKHMITADKKQYYFKDIVFDNIAVMYGGAHGMHATYVDNFTVKNCVFEWIGGGIQSYAYHKDDPGKPIRYGNAVETGYSKEGGYHVSASYFNEIYDCALTFQTSEGAVDEWVRNVEFNGNLIENCTYSMECFMGSPATEGAEKYIENCVFSDNIMRLCGSGFGSTRPDKSAAAHIKLWSHYNAVKDNSFIIENNIFDRSEYMIIDSRAAADNSDPILRNNTYIQYAPTENETSSFGYYGKKSKLVPFDESILGYFRACHLGEYGKGSGDNIFFASKSSEK